MVKQNEIILAKDHCFITSITEAVYQFLVLIFLLEAFLRGGKHLVGREG